MTTIATMATMTRHAPIMAACTDLRDSIAARPEAGELVFDALRAMLTTATKRRTEYAPLDGPKTRNTMAGRPCTIAHNGGLVEPPLPTWLLIAPCFSNAQTELEPLTCCSLSHVGHARTTVQSCRTCLFRSHEPSCAHNHWLGSKPI